MNNLKKAIVYLFLIVFSSVLFITAIYFSMSYIFYLSIILIVFYILLTCYFLFYVYKYFLDYFSFKKKKKEYQVIKFKTSLDFENLKEKLSLLKYHIDNNDNLKITYFSFGKRINFVCFSSICSNLIYFNNSLINFINSKNPNSRNLIIYFTDKVDESYLFLNNFYNLSANRFYLIICNGYLVYAIKNDEIILCKEFINFIERTFKYEK